MAEKQIFGLSKAKQNAVLALARERERVIRETNRQVAEINGSLQELAETFGALHAIEGGGRWGLENDPKDPGRVVLVYEPAGLADAENEQYVAEEETTED